MDTTDFYTPVKELPNKPIVPPISFKPSISTNESSLHKLNNNPQTAKPIDPSLFTNSANSTIYYRPPSTSIDPNFGLKDQVESKPILRLKQPRAEDVDPVSGNWTNPVLETALKRQINKEAVVKGIMSAVLFLLVIELGKRVMKMAVNFDATSPASIIEGILVVKIVYGGIKLARGQDQCLDLPLSNKQRSMLGLRMIEGNDVKISHEKFARNVNIER
ncbi:hypothetical protein CLIB1444_06S07580 [[Candida] jaroonii]|uniref:Uncharacterized protein n=1 Tax=[Candida] jaroonii TaxID=467808 RepID=A0ACA9Y9M5_9ASCO|nr:hypothetical protein CLIB1444_06S07580 [[Candida] jaroonii]